MKATSSSETLGNKLPTRRHNPEERCGKLELHIGNWLRLESTGVLHRGPGRPATDA